MELIINGEDIELPDNDGRSLLTVLRADLGLTGTKESCSRGECGACTVLMSGRPVLSCILLAGMVDGPIETIEGLEAETQAVRRAFADHGGFQCGYCTPGQVVHAAAILRRGSPTADGDLRHALAGNICRCTGYQSIVSSIMTAAGEARPGAQSAGLPASDAEEPA